MAKLYFRYGAMGCSKTANALMVAFNYEEKGLKPLVLKPKIETRDGEKTIKSRIGLSRPCEYVEDYIKADFARTKPLVQGYDCIIIDEVQFCRRELMFTLREIVVKMEIPVIAYGLREDFLQNPFPASELLCAVADKVEEMKTVCWCGAGAVCNARLDKEGNVVREGEQIVLGGNEMYISLCRKHYLRGDIGPKMRGKFQKQP